MDPITFFAGLQALAAFLQVWQVERKQVKAAEAYFRAKKEALSDPHVIARATEFKRQLAKSPKFARLLKNRIGQCEDKFEEALRDDDEERLEEAARVFVRCKCLILETFKTAQGGKLEGELAEDWEELACDRILARSAL